MSFDRTKILALLDKSFPQDEIVLNDLKGDGNYYSLTITSTSFKGKSRVQQHQMVYNSLKGYVGDVIHALSLKTIEKND
ncbi:MAG: ATP-binding protein [Alphaproteobacteria bacterium RIFCSPLOWO2_01_FULL_45_8]|nr:MAG: ATP-binding protein [Alphaproteobacteria bacterium GWB1_45_5]OFW76533.1 MAG: ATP-binding protein [Alphaproteobacteria bacterium GWA1_45_9]OFW90293.1 MAG: ATP-binding protein [Alphaproteobacteria bacterium RIFCSPHIGHO2_01_FULL_41_14]OFW96547.1 MAG: ATP-binding protein [Alphaproteobacteria bacterium RIFCSPLOWO2_01_FULL_45_8]HCI48588.1 BolA family transcriptional regulator [Holosporales bacterium]